MRSFSRQVENPTYSLLQLPLGMASEGVTALRAVIFPESVHNLCVRTQEDLVQTIIAEGVNDPSVLQALRQVPRAQFVPSDVVEQAYLDRPLPIPHGQVTTQPSLTAKMIEALRLTGSEHVLEVGTGYGFQTALLAHLSDFVWSVERWSDISGTARANLTRHGLTNVEALVGDGTEGLLEHAPYEAILVSAAFPRVPPPLVEQLAPGGRLVQPIGSGGQELVILFAKGPGGLMHRCIVTGAHFVRLYGTHAF
jgi:protein-L-isoaspartate(D-aspartate) O-methyltransferase